MIKWAFSRFVLKTCRCRASMGNLFPSWAAQWWKQGYGLLHHFWVVLWKRGGEREKRIKWVKKKCNNLMLSSGQAEGAVHISPPIFCLHSELAFPSSSFPQKAAGTSGIFHFSWTNGWYLRPVSLSTSLSQSVRTPDKNITGLCKAGSGGSSPAASSISTPKHSSLIPSSHQLKFAVCGKVKNENVQHFPHQGRIQGIEWGSRTTWGNGFSS